MVGWSDIAHLVGRGANKIARAADVSVLAGWTDDGVNVRLTLDTDTVTIGTATPTPDRKLTVRTTGVDTGIGVVVEEAGNVAFLAILANETLSRFLLYGNGQMTWSDGADSNNSVTLAKNADNQLFIQGVNIDGPGSVLDVLLLQHLTNTLPALDGIGTGLLFHVQDDTPATIAAARVAAVLTTVAHATVTSALDFYTRSGGSALTAQWRITGAGSFIPLQDNTLAVGTSAARVAALALGSTGVRVYAVGGDANPVTQLASGGVAAGAGGGTAVDTFLRRTASRTWTLDDGAAGAITTRSIGSLITQGRSIRTTYLAADYTMDSGSAPDDLIGEDATAANRTVSLVAAVDGRRIFIVNTSTFGAANHVTVGAFAGEHINTAIGAATSIALTAAQFVELIGRTGFGWYPVSTL